jgi:hypothetical protein
MKDVCNSGVYTGFVCPLTEGELEATITELRSGWGAIDDMGQFARILATDHPEAIQFATTELGSGVTAYSSEVTSSLIRTVARFSPPSFWESLEPCLKHHGRDVRCEAAAALEQLGAKRSLSLIRRCLSGEDDVVVQKNLVRALGSAGADSSSVAKTLMKYGESDDERLIRLNAYLALGYHAGRENVHEFLVEALKDEDPEVRQAAAMAMAFSRIGTYRQAIVDAREKEPSEEVRSLFDRSVAVLDGENLRVFTRDYRHIGGDDVPRARYLGP